jgi:hypothetical protein
MVDPQVAALDPTKFLQTLQERHVAGVRFRIVCGHVHEHADAPHLVRLLRSRRVATPPRRREA